MSPARAKRAPQVGPSLVTKNAVRLQEHRQQCYRGIGVAAPGPHHDVGESGLASRDENMQGVGAQRENSRLHSLARRKIRLKRARGKFKVRFNFGASAVCAHPHQSPISLLLGSLRQPCLSVFVTGDISRRHVSRKRVCSHRRKLHKIMRRRSEVRSLEAGFSRETYR